MKKRSSRIWDYPKEDFEKVVRESVSFSDILRKLGLSTGNGNWKILKKRLNEEQIPFAHIPAGNLSNKGRSFPLLSIPLSEMLIEHSLHARANIKRRLLKENLIENKCSICGIEPFWNGKQMVLILDHINGINDDYRIDNLRLVCPNCNSQLPTTNRANYRQRKEYFCSICGNKISKWGKICKKCSTQKRRKVKNIPLKEELIDLVRKFPMTKIGEKYEVSDNAVRKWCKEYGIIT